MALIPDAVRSLADRGIDVVVEAGAGSGSGHPDTEYTEAGATVGSGEDAWSADVVAHVAVPTTEEIGRV